MQRQLKQDIRKHIRDIAARDTERVNQGAKRVIILAVKVFFSEEKLKPIASASSNESIGELQNND